VKVDALRIYFLVWTALIILTIWLDRWFVTVGFGSISCALGALAAITPTKAGDRERREYKHVGIVMMVAGSVMSLIAIIGRFLLAYFIR
jgi:hypothetical protein